MRDTEKSIDYDQLALNRDGRELRAQVTWNEIKCDVTNVIDNVAKAIDGLKKIESAIVMKISDPFDIEARQHMKSDSYVKVRGQDAFLRHKIQINKSSGSFSDSWERAVEKRAFGKNTRTHQKHKQWTNKFYVYTEGECDVYTRAWRHVGRSGAKNYNEKVFQNEPDWARYLELLTEERTRYLRDIRDTRNELTKKFRIMLGKYEKFFEEVS